MTNEELQTAITALLYYFSTAPMHMDDSPDGVATKKLLQLLCEQVKRATGGKIDYSGE